MLTLGRSEARAVGLPCRQLAKELHLDWDTVKTLEKQYMQAQLAKAGTPGPKAIGIDEISIRKGRTVTRLTLSSPR